MTTFHLSRSGAEAVEAAVKLARHATGKQNIIAVNLGYHGRFALDDMCSNASEQNNYFCSLNMSVLVVFARTMGTMALTTSGTIYRAGFGPLMGGTVITPFPYLSQVVVFWKLDLNHC